MIGNQHGKTDSPFFGHMHYQEGDDDVTNLEENTEKKALMTGKNQHIADW